MLEQYSKLMIKEWVDKFLLDLKSSSLPMPHAWSFRELDDISIITRRGLLLIQWRDPQDGDRLKATFSYDDNGVFPFVSLVFDRNNVLQELEIWRGDGKPLIHTPSASDLEIPVELR